MGFVAHRMGMKGRANGGLHCVVFIYHDGRIYVLVSRSNRYL